MVSLKLEDGKLIFFFKLKVINKHKGRINKTGDLAMFIRSFKVRLLLIKDVKQPKK